MYEDTISSGVLGQAPTDEDILTSDPGRAGDAPKPFSPEEYEELKEDARATHPTDGHPELAEKE
jgi:hypothetical protein